MTGRAITLLVLATACANGNSSAPAEVGHARVTVERLLGDTLRDTIRFDAAIESRRCIPPGHGLVLDAVTGGSGMLLWIRPADSALGGTYRYAPASDTTGARSVVAAIRFVAQEAPRGLVLDSGRLDVDARDGTLHGSVSGSGLAMPGGFRVRVDASFRGAPVPGDSVACEVGS